MDIEKIFLNIIIIILILAVLALAVFNIKTPNNKEGFTELYFVWDLPKEVELNKEYHFSFAIHNLENRNMEYKYSVYLNSDKINESNLNIENNYISIVKQGFIVKDKIENSSIPVSVQL